MPGSLVFVVDKPFVAKELAPHLARKYPDQIIHLVCTMYVGLYAFAYPRGLSIEDFPIIDIPKWKLRDVPNAVWAVVSGEAKQSPLPPDQVISEADEIIFAGEPSHSGAISFHTLLSQVLGAEAGVSERPAHFLWHGYYAKALEEHVTTTADPQFQQWLRTGEARRFFDFNFNVNALALFSPWLKRAGAPDNAVISKYGLQLLYSMMEDDNATECELHDRMKHWIGSGRYAPTQLGSAASRAQIIADLYAAGLLKADDSRYQLTNRGWTFLSLLHPDCEDPDLPTRLEQWGQSWPKGRPQMERYLRTVFGKQKRFGPKAVKRFLG